MGLFSDKKKEQKLNEEKRVELLRKISEENNSNDQKLNDEKMHLQDQINTLVKKESELEGILVDVEGSLFDTNFRYKFFLDEDNNYCFLCHLAGFVTREIDGMKQIVDKSFFILKKDDYICTYLNDSTQWYEVDEYAGELETVILPIKIKFTEKSNQHNNIIITIKNFGKDLLKFSTLLERLNPKNSYDFMEIQKDSFQIIVENGDGFLANSLYQIYRKDNELIFIRPVKSEYPTDVTKIRVVRLSIDEIMYYKSEGVLRYEQQLSGGGGMGINYGGALVGGILFGNAGAIIGSRRNEEIKDIKSETVTHDTRMLILVVRRENKIFQIRLSIGAELALDWLLPDKQYDYVIQKRRFMYEKMRT